MSVIADSFDAFWKKIKPLVTGTDSFSIPTSAWTIFDPEAEDEFAYYADFTDQSVTASDFITCILDTSSIDAAEEAKLSARPESLTGKIRFRAQNIPSQAVTGRYWRSRSMS